jgi:hypothetical protein
LLDLAKVCAADFSGHIGTRFRILLGGDDSVGAVLLEVSPLGDPSKRPPELPPREPFSLLFRLSDGVQLPQGTYRVHHDSLGHLDLFLAPVGGALWESVFN